MANKPLCVPDYESQVQRQALKMRIYNRKRSADKDSKVYDQSKKLIQCPLEELKTADKPMNSPRCTINKYL